jgi:hypothetical protein
MRHPLVEWGGFHLKLRTERPMSPLRLGARVAQQLRSTVIMGGW